MAYARKDGEDVLPGKRSWSGQEGSEFGLMIGAHSGTLRGGVFEVEVTMIWGGFCFVAD
jgi:hypothetical protein